jgi:hypothetical protein
MGEREKDRKGRRNKEKACFDGFEIKKKENSERGGLSKRKWLRGGSRGE